MADPTAATTVDHRRVPAAPPFGAVLRAAASDFYFNSWRLAPANILWVTGLVAVLVVASAWSPLALLALPALAIPTAGLARMTARIARGEAVTFSDFRLGMARAWRPALVAAAGGTLLTAVLVTNIARGLEWGGMLGWTFSALAAYAAVGTAMVLVAFWPLLGDPARSDQPLITRLRLAGLVCLARPGRMAILTVALGLFLAASTVLFAVLATAAVALAMLVATRTVLPIADQLDPVGQTAAQADSEASGTRPA